jgi:hypothetical protein
VFVEIWKEAQALLPKLLSGLGAELSFVRRSPRRSRLEPVLHFRSRQSEEQAPGIIGRRRFSEQL